MTETEILERIVFVGGPPRSGTTFAARSLNLHPGFVAAIDDHVYECWGLYYYRDMVGLVRELLTRQLSAEDAQKVLAHHLFADGRLAGAATSGKTTGFPLVASSTSPCPGSVRSALDRDLQRCSIPLGQFSRKWRLCLKSPEISFVLPQLAGCFPDAKFVLVYRPVVEIAESMHRIGDVVKRFPTYHKRWIAQRGETGDLVPPPGVPTEWHRIWQNASDFQRCVVYAASYVQGILEGIGRLAPDRYFIYDHALLRRSPSQVFRQLAGFLAVESSGFQAAVTQLRADPPPIPPELAEEYSEVEIELSLRLLMHKIEALTASAVSG